MIVRELLGWHGLSRLCGAFVVAVVLGGWLLAHPADAQDGGRQDSGSQQPRAQIRLAQAPAQPKAKAPATAEAAQPAAWALQCSDRAEGKLACEMTQNVIEASTQRQIALISVKGATEGGSTAMLVRVFHGVYLPAGVAIRIDGGQPSPVAFQKSDQFGVYAALPLTPNLVAELKRGKELKIAVEINKGEPVTITALLNGFGGAYDRVTAIK